MLLPEMLNPRPESPAPSHHGQQPHSLPSSHPRRAASRRERPKRLLRVEDDEAEAPVITGTAPS